MTVLKTMQARLIAHVLIALIAVPSVLSAHAGEDHDGTGTSTQTAIAGMQGDVLTSSSTTDYFEVVAKYAVTDAGDDTRLRLFVADYATNRPIDGATLALAFKPAGVVIRKAPTMVSAGVYDLVVMFPNDEVYSVVATVTAGKRTDFVELRNLYAGTVARKFLEEHATTGNVAAVESGASWIEIAAGAAGVLLLAAIVFLVLRRRRTSRQSAGTSKAREQESAIVSDHPVEPSASRNDPST